MRGNCGRGGGGSKGRAATALGLAVTVALGVGAGRGSEPHKSLPLLGLKESKFEREREDSETRKGKYEMKNEGKWGLYRGGGR